MNQAHFTHWPLAAAFLSVVLLACGPASAGPGSSAAPIKDQPPAPDFALVAYQGEQVLGGQEVRFAQVIGQGKPVVLNFWAGQCPPCRAEMPDFEKVHQKYKDRVLVFGLDVGPFLGLGSREDGKALLRELKITYPAGTTFDPKVIEAYGLLGMPTTVFITSSGHIARKHTGIVLEQQITEFVEDLLSVSRGS